MINSESGLLEKLEQYSKSNTIPMHMPGHKRNIKIASYLEKLGAKYDITEIDGFDNLHDASGIIAHCMEHAARLWNSKKSYFLVNGSTCGILAGVYAATKRGDKVLVARNCHKSVYHAIELCGLNPVFIVPPIDNEFNIYASVKAQSIKDSLDENPDISLIIITSPTYEGVISDIKTICEIAHERSISVLVDEAHGAHIGFSDFFSGGAVNSGADIVIQSLHKTLPSLTQTAIAHLNGNIIDETKFSSALEIFETSSPSYLLLSSIDGCVNLIENNGRELFSLWEKNLKNFSEKVKQLNNLKILFFGNDKKENHPLIYNFDYSKIVISTKDTSITGKMLMDLLRQQFSIELEMAAGEYAVAMTGLGDESKNFDLLANALLKIDETCTKCQSKNDFSLISQLPNRACSIKEAWSLKHKFISIADALWKTSAEYVWAYPPGVPLIIPGEVIDKTFLDIITKLAENGVQLKSTYKTVPDSLAVIFK